MPRIKLPLPRRLAQRIARYAAKAGISLDEAAERCLGLAINPPVFISHSWLDTEAVAAAVVAALEVQ